jgi:methionyl-tRNA formyltransferase
VLLREAVPIGEETTAGALHDALAALGARLAVEALRGIAAGALRAEPQPEEGVTYASKIAKDEARLAWARPAAELARAVRAFNPFPGAFFELGGERIRVLAARAEPGRGEPGTALDDALLVACGEGALRALVVQRAGRAAMKAADFLRGRAVPAGTRLS